jgi:hypothetical protein
MKIYIKNIVVDVIDGKSLDGKSLDGKSLSEQCFADNVSAPS